MRSSNINQQRLLKYSQAKVIKHVRPQRLSASFRSRTNSPGIVNSRRTIALAFKSLINFKTQKAIDCTNVIHSFITLDFFMTKRDVQCVCAQSGSASFVAWSVFVIAARTNINVDGKPVKNGKRQHASMEEVCEEKEIKRSFIEYKAYKRKKVSEKQKVWIERKKLDMKDKQRFVLKKCTTKQNKENLFLLLFWKIWKIRIVCYVELKINFASHKKRSLYSTSAFLWSLLQDTQRISHAHFWHRNHWSFLLNSNLFLQIVADE